MEESSRKSLSLPSTSIAVPSLISRLDRLDSLMKRLEVKTEKEEASGSRWASSSKIGPLERDDESVPLDWAVMEAQARGSVSERIASLEFRLVQLFLSMESEGVADSPSQSSPLMEQTSPDTFTNSSCVTTAAGSSLSFSRFRTSNRINKHASGTRTSIDKFEVRGVKEEEEQQKGKHGEVSEENANSRKVEERSSQKLKKTAPSRLHLRLLGC